jgi:hypothetical protein
MIGQLIAIKTNWSNYSLSVNHTWQRNLDARLMLSNTEVFYECYFTKSHGLFYSL